MQQNFVRKEFFFHTAKYGPDFFFSTWSWPNFVVANSPPPENELVSVLGDVVTGMIVKI
jgi:hypothetical protein